MFLEFLKTLINPFKIFKRIAINLSLYMFNCYKIILTSFHQPNRNANEVIWQFWNRGNSLFVTQGTSQFLCVSQFFPIHGLAVVVKKKSSTSGFAARGGFFFHHAC